MQLTPTIRIAVSLATVVLLAFNFMFARLELSRQSTALPTIGFEEVRFEKPEILAAGFLNYTTFAADLAWVALVVNYGRARIESWRLDSLDENATVVRILDPYFYRVYDWFITVWPSLSLPFTYEKAEVARAFAEEGFERFPEDPDLGFYMAMTYVGLDDSSRAERAARYRAIIDLLTETSKRKDAVPEIPGTLAHYKRRLEALELGREPSRDEQLPFYIELFQVTNDPKLRAQLLRTIRGLGGADRLQAEAVTSRLQLEENWDDKMPYVSLPLYVYLSESE